MKIGPYLERIAQIIEEDKTVPKKQRHTAKGIYERLREMGYGGKYTQVKEPVRELLRVKQGVFIPLVHRGGEAQVDFGYALAKASKQVAAGAEAAGAKVETFYLHSLSIKPCDACREEMKKDCILPDDMKELYPKLREADVVVIASPIYGFTVSAQSKLFMDRWYALGDPKEYF